MIDESWTEKDEKMLGTLRRGTMRWLLIGGGALTLIRGGLEAASGGDGFNALLWAIAGLYFVLMGFNGKEDK